MLFAYRIWKITRYASSGLVSFTTAMLFCDKISLYGFYPFHRDSHNNTIKYHYYDERDIDFNKNMHKMPKEYSHLVKLRDEGVIRLVTDKCTWKTTCLSFYTLNYHLNFILDVWVWGVYGCVFEMECGMCCGVQGCAGVCVVGGLGGCGCKVGVLGMCVICYKCKMNLRLYQTHTR